MIQLAHKQTTEAIIGSAFAVFNTLGYGFLEKVYQKAMQVELIQRGHTAEIEYPIKVKYKGVIVGEYYADLFVDEKVIVELKVCKEYNSMDEPQLLNELKATNTQVGMLVNFGRNKVEFRRFVY